MSRITPRSLLASMRALGSRSRPSAARPARARGSGSACPSASRSAADTQVVGQSALDAPRSHRSVAIAATRPFWRSRTLACRRCACESAAAFGQLRRIRGRRAQGAASHAPLSPCSWSYWSLASQPSRGAIRPRRGAAPLGGSWRCPLEALKPVKRRPSCVLRRPGFPKGTSTSSQHFRIDIVDKRSHGGAMREESCFSGTIELYVPPRPPAYTPVAISIPDVSGACQRSELKNTAGLA